jgi:hypothetical protein
VIEVDHRIAAVEGLDRRHLEPAQPYLLGDLFRRRLDVNKLTQPREH